MQITENSSWCVTHCCCAERWVDGCCCAERFAAGLLGSRCCWCAGSSAVVQNAVQSGAAGVLGARQSGAAGVQGSSVAVQSAVHSGATGVQGSNKAAWLLIFIRLFLVTARILCLTSLLKVYFNVLRRE